MLVLVSVDQRLLMNVMDVLMTDMSWRLEMICVGLEARINHDVGGLSPTCSFTSPLLRNLNHCHVLLLSLKWMKSFNSSPLT